MRKTWITLACLLAAASWVTARAQSSSGDDSYRTSAEIRINLPDGVEPHVTVWPGTQRVVLELPQDSVYPLDFQASSGGLLRKGEVHALDNGRMRLELDLAMGVLDRVVYEADAVILRFQSRFDVQSRAENDEEGYVLGPNDGLLVTVHGHEDLTTELTISRGGMITLPLIGDVEAAGLSPRQLAARLAELLGRDFLVDPQIDVTVEEYRSQWAMAAGEIRVPGRVALEGGTRLKEILSEAGGFSEQAGELITITRKTDNADDEFVTMEIARADFESGDSNPMLQHGDIITISEAKYAYLQGEVSSPGRVRIERGLTLLKAIAQVGGVTDWANMKKIQVLAGDGTRPSVYNLKDIQLGKSPDPLLRGGEIIVVKRRFF